jgi:hypothetical protein
MDRRKFLVVLLPVFMLWSCQPIMMKFYGIKDPDIETEKSIFNKALKYELDTSNIVTISSSVFFDVLNGQAIPDASIFDRDGRYVEYRQTDSACNAGLFEFIPALNLLNKYNQPDSADLQSILINCRDLRGNSLAILESADFYVLIYWTVWTGRLNKDHVKIWEDLAKNNPNCKIKVIKLNLDMQDWWEPQDKDKIYNAMRRKK